MALGLMFVLAAGCTEQVDTSARYVFQHDIALTYLQKHEQYSQYVELLKQTPISRYSESRVGQLLGARGHYTVFAPTNEAIDSYLEELFLKDAELMSAPRWDAFCSDAKRDSVRRVLVMNSIIDSGDMDDCFMTWDFPITDRAEIPLSNMNNRKLSVHYEGTDTILLNGLYPIDVKQRDILVTNGVIHQVNRVVAPDDITAAGYLQDIIDHSRTGYLLMAKAIQACGLMDTLSKIRDEVYEDRYLRGEIPEYVSLYIDWHNTSERNATPKHRLYGFTIFAETDDFWLSQGIDPQEPSSVLLPKLVRWIQDNHQYSDDDRFTLDTNYESEENLLYQWVTYHILPFRASADRLVFHVNESGFSYKNPGVLGIPMYEIYTTMGKPRLLKLYESKASEGVYLNRFPNLDDGRRGSYQEISCDPDKVGCRVNRESEQAVLNDIVNCCIYPIDKPLSYNDHVRDNLARQRLRFDGMTLFPEAMNNEIRLKQSSDFANQDVYIPNTSIYNYFENMQMNDQTIFIYLNAYAYDWPNLHSDEMKAKGRFELTFKLPPVPRRTTYELRYNVLPNGDRGIQQFYFGSDLNRLPVAGIPVNLTRAIDSMKAGYEPDTDDDEYNAEVDKRLRNNNVMKGVLSVTGTGAPTNNERIATTNLRYIIVRQPMDPDKTYYLRIKSVLDSEQKEFYMDYMEFCPKEVYDNPEKPEDIW
ncbi:MAG: fasciclin domain-containing protein [Bacteroidaceae bacterium]|nr:fasciclin domain-containing protein [Bacteroidaceae bacterium]